MPRAPGVADTEQARAERQPAEEAEDEQHDRRAHDDPVAGRRLGRVELHARPGRWLPGRRISPGRRRRWVPPRRRVTRLAPGRWRRVTGRRWRRWVTAGRRSVSRWRPCRRSARRRSRSRGRRRLRCGLTARLFGCRRRIAAGWWLCHSFLLYMADCGHAHVTYERIHCAEGSVRVAPAEVPTRSCRQNVANYRRAVLCRGRSARASPTRERRQDV